MRFRLSTYMYDSPRLPSVALVACQPWARDAAAYEAGMSGHGFKQIDTGVEYGAAKGGYTTKKKVRGAHSGRHKAEGRQAVLQRSSWGTEECPVVLYSPRLPSPFVSQTLALVPLRPSNPSR